MLYSFEDRVPKILSAHCYISDQATLIGSVIIEDNVCILPGAILRADNAIIHIKLGTNIQDGAILHTDPDAPMIIEENVTIGHRAMLHGSRVGENTLIGIGAIVLNHAEIGKNCIVGANALVLERQIIPDGSLAVGSPAKVKKQLEDTDIAHLKTFHQHYVDKISRFKSGLKLISE